MTESADTAKAIRLREANGWGDTRIGLELGRSRHWVRHALLRHKLGTPPAIIAPTGALSRYEAARQALAEAKNVDEVKDIHDKAEAMRVYGRMAKDVEMEVDAAEIRLRAERKLGLLIVQQKEVVGLNRGALRRGTKEEPRDERPTLADAGIDKKLSSRSQRVAGIADPAFETMIEGVRARMMERNGRVSLDLLKQEKTAKRRAEYEQRTYQGGTVEDLHALAASGFRAGAILADPAWHFVAHSDKGEGRSASQHYNTQALDDILTLPVAQLAGPNCVLFLWMVDWLPTAALEVIDAWGFEHKTTAFTWAKSTKSGDGWHMGNGYWTRANPESCWLATRGHPARMNADVRQLIIGPVGEHSEKPDEVHDRIERLVGGPYLELNARRERAGWVTWGDELKFKMPAVAEEMSA